VLEDGRPFARFVEV